MSADAPPAALAPPAELPLPDPAADAASDAGFALRFLDAGNALPGIRALKPAMVSKLALRRGLRVLELGCGAGDDARALARRVGRDGHVLGVDAAPALVEEAERRSRGRGLPVAFRVGDARALDLPDASFDRVRVERLLMHVDGDPAAVLRECARVLRPGGRLAVFDFDWDTLAIAGADRAMTREVVRSHADGLPRGAVGRELPRLLEEAGFERAAAAPHGVEIPYDFFGWLVCSHLDAALAVGRFSERELIRWWDELDRAHASGGFFAAVLGLLVAGATPAGG